MKTCLLENKDLYPKLHKQVFGTDDFKMPETVYIAKTDDDVIFGFVSGNWNFDGSFYIEFAGILPEFRTKGYLRHLKSILIPNVNYITVTHQDNILAQKTLLSIGFKIIGCRCDPGGFYIEWARRVKNGNS